MKLATLKDDSRDGRLVVVSRDLKRCVVSDRWAFMQQALDHWDEAEPELNRLYEQLNQGSAASAQDFNLEKVWAPLPRAYEWVDGSAYINHIMLVRKSRGAEIPETLRTDPLVYQGGSSEMLSWQAPIEFVDDSWGLDFESEIAVVLADTPKRVRADHAGSYIRLVTIVNDVSLRGLIPAELAKGFGFFASKPASAFAPVAVTPDELGDAWKDGRVHLPLVTHLNGSKFGDPHAGPEMHFSFYDLIFHITKTRSFTAGTILGSGTVSNEDRARGSSCLLERRMIETIDHGKPQTPFLKPGDRVEIEMFDQSGTTIFGKIQQKVEKASAN